MKNFFYIYRDLMVTFIFCTLSANLLAQENSYLSESEWLEANANDPQPAGQECKEFMQSKGWSAKPSSNDGKGDYYYVGVGTIQAPMTSNLFVESTLNASVKALNDAKRQLAEELSLQITSNATSSFVEAIRDGAPPDLIIGDEVDMEGRDYDDLDSIEKMTLLFHQQLDKLIDQSTKDAVASDSAQREAIEESIQQVQSQEQFKRLIRSQAVAEVRGMTTKYSHYTANPGGRNTVCVVAKWNEKSARLVDAMMRKDFSKIKSQNGRRPTTIPDVKTFEGGKKLQGLFGVYPIINENGEWGIWSFAQASINGKSIASEKAAKRVANRAARTQISEFVYSSLELVDKVKNYESTTTFTDESEFYYGDREYDARLKIASQMDQEGISVVDNWVSRSLLKSQKNRIAGAILEWSPSSVKSSMAVSQGMGTQSSSDEDDDNTSESISIGATIGDDDL